MNTLNLPPGFRFHPTDEELVGYYLKKKVEGEKFELDVIPVIDLYKFDPWQLPERSFLPWRDMRWFFFCPRDKKYPNGSRTNRATASGYWKATGKDRKVICPPVTALRKTLVFYKGRAPAGDRTDWVMHEYRLCEDSPPGFTNFVGAFALCHIMKKNEQKQKDGDYKEKTIVSSEIEEDSLGSFQHSQVTGTHHEILGPAMTVYPPDDLMDLCAIEAIEDSQSFLVEIQGTSIQQTNGLDWPFPLPPICRQTSGDGGEPANLWAWEDSAGAC